MKRTLFLFLSLLPYLATAQVAKDTVTVLTSAQITAHSPNDTANVYFVIANAWRKANFDSIARYTRNRFQTLTLDSTHIAANGLSLQGTELTGTLPVSRGGTGRTAMPTGYLLFGGGTAVDTSINLFFDTTNSRLGLGLTNPGSRLVVKGAGNTDATSAFNVINSNNNNMFFVRNDGKVGIGTDTPAYKLQIANNALADLALSDPTEATDQKNWVFQYGSIIGSGTFRLRAINDNGTDGKNAYIITRSGTTIQTHQWLTSGSERMRLDASGNFGIGATPAVQLHTTGGVRFAGLANITDLRTDADGDLFNGSDFNLKNSINPISYGINDIMKLRPVEFYWNKESRNSSLYKNLGFIAQDVMDAIPNAASIMGDGDLQIDYNALVATLVKAIQEQQAQIEALKARIAQLENK